jgi:hypothetical protein
MRLGTSDGFRFGETHYQWRRPRSRGLLKQLFEMYFKEDITTFSRSDRKIFGETQKTLSQLSTNAIQLFREIRVAEFPKQHFPACPRSG